MSNFSAYSSRGRLLRFLQEYLNPVSFCAIATSTQTISRNTLTTVVFDEETFTGVGYDTTTYTFTAPYDGRYQFYSNVMWYNMATTLDYVTLAFKHNDTTLYAAQDGVWAVTQDDFTLHASIMLDMSENDTVLVQAKYDDDAPVATEQIYGISPQRYTQFFGHKI